jgi:NAD(P) transhydrogenase subunit alpha
MSNLSTEALLLILTIFILAIFIGIEVISKVPTVLHTPLMSGTNAIHGIVLMAAMLVAGIAVAGKGWGLTLIGFLAVILGTVYVVGGFVVTDRMLEMFKAKQPPKDTKK